MAIADTVPTQKCCDNTHGHFNCAVHNSSVRSVDKMYRDSCNVEPTVGTTFIPSIKDTDDRLLLDSGASGYMVRRHDWFVNLRNIQPKSIFVGNGDVLMARKIGNIRLKVILSDKCGADDIVRTIIIRNVLYVPDLAINLISCSQLCENAYDIKFKGHRGRAMLNGYIEFECRMEDGVYVINCAVGNAGSVSAFTVRDDPLALWHDRLGHANLKSIRELERKDAVIGLDLTLRKKPANDCGDCKQGKQHKSVMKSKTLAVKKGAVIHSDVSGKMSTRPIGGSMYYVTFIDEFSRYITVVPITTKGEVLQQFKKFHVWFERKYDCRIKTLHCDGGGEYVGCDTYLSEHGIERVHIPPHAPEMNGLAERVNRTLMESARAMMFHGKMPSAFWAEAVVHAAEIRNRFICPRSDFKTAYELMTSTKPRVDHLRVFGSLAWAFVPKEQRRKLDAKSEEGVVIGCFENSLYKIWVPERKCAILSRHLTILENKFPASGWHRVPGPSSALEDQTKSSDTQRQDKTTRSIPRPPQETAPTVHAQPDAAREVATKPRGTVRFGNEQLERLTYVPVHPSTYGVDDQHDGERSDIRSTKSRSDVDESERSGSRKEGHGNSSESKYPQRERRRTEFYHPESSFLAELCSEPTTVSQAMDGDEADCWKNAIDSELQSLRQHTVWTVEKLPDGVKPLETRFVFKNKMMPDGTVGRYKARLVVKGFLQGHVEHTFAPVIDFTTVRVLLAVAVQRGLYIHQMDVRTAFLHGDIDDTMFIRPPEGSKIDVPHGHGLQLRKGLYGLKQAPRLWYEKWMCIIGEIHGEELGMDSCLFRIRDVWVLLYVDDIILIGPTVETLESVKAALSEKLEIKDLGELGSFLGVKFVRDQGGAWLLQCHYIDEMMNAFGMNGCKGVTTPAVQSIKQTDETKAVDRTYYQKMVGALLFLASRTRPDISLAVNLLTRKCSSPTKTDPVAAKRVLQYLSHTRDMGIRLGKHEGQLVGYCDADWGGDITDRKSTSGILLKIGATPVFWKSRKQRCVSLSTSEAELIAFSETCQQILWVRSILKELGTATDAPTTIFEDNTRALHWGDRRGQKREAHFYPQELCQGTSRKWNCEPAVLFHGIHDG